MRKGAGISALSRHTAQTSSYSTLSSSISAQQLSTLQQSLQSFRDALLSFASAHRGDIRADPAFRHQFQKMCAAIGVDPLAGSDPSTSKGGRGAGGWWGLGLGEWSCELAVQVVDVCISTRTGNGGMIEVQELISRIERMRGGSFFLPSSSSISTSAGGVVRRGVTQEDVVRSLDLLRPLNCGYSVHQVGRALYVRSVPRELDTDQSALLVIAADSGGRLTHLGVRRHTGWTEVRVNTAMDDCVMREGMGWVDDQAEGGKREVWVLAAVEFEHASGT